MKLNNILITGGCGFLGQHLTKYILDKFPEIKIKIIDLKANPNPVYDFSKYDRIQIELNRNICEYDSIKNDFDNIDVVIHLAGVISFSIKDKDFLHNVNVNGTANVLRAAKNGNVNKVIHISSVAALGYDNKKDKPVNEKFKFDWKKAVSKKKYYMLSKHLADVEVEKYRKQGLDIVILYPGLLYGPGDMTNTSRLIKAIKDQRIPFNMPGGTNIIDVRDVAKGIIDVLRKNPKNEDFLLSGHNMMFVDSNRIIAEVLSVDPPKRVMPKFLNFPLFHLFMFIETISKNKVELTADNVDSGFLFRYFDNSKALEKLGWKPETKFKETITDTVKWLEKNGYFKE